MSRFIGIDVPIRLLYRCAHHKRAALHSLQSQIDSIDLELQALQRIRHYRFMPLGIHRHQAHEQAYKYNTFFTHAFNTTNIVPKYVFGKKGEQIVVGRYVVVTMW